MRQSGLGLSPTDTKICSQIRLLRVLFCNSARDVASIWSSLRVHYHLGFLPSLLCCFTALVCMSAGFPQPFHGVLSWCLALALVPCIQKPVQPFFVPRALLSSAVKMQLHSVLCIWSCSHGACRLCIWWQCRFVVIFLLGACTF